MLTYRRIEHEEKYAALVWKCESAAPDWFKRAGEVWTPDFDSFLSFWRNCREIHGLFDGETLVACVYLEFICASRVNIHVSVVGSIDHDSIVRFFISLQRQKRREGVRDMRGWILDKNRQLRELARRAGFEPTGLTMSYGSAKNRVLNWVEVAA